MQHRRTRHLIWAVNGLTIGILVLSLGLLAMGDWASGGLGVVGAVVLWQEVQYG